MELVLRHAARQSPTPLPIDAARLARNVLTREAGWTGKTNGASAPHDSHTARFSIRIQGSCK
ncbi:MAG: hypothetical protein JWQ00_1195 [Noviherbaspirillum sp.]|jgi:hypothetical protein|nr:hypothetical protein [Noviherbaspirillum sp.]